MRVPPPSVLAQPRTLRALPDTASLFSFSRPRPSVLPESTCLLVPSRLHFLHCNYERHPHLVLFLVSIYLDHIQVARGVSLSKVPAATEIRPTRNRVGFLF